MRSHPLHKVLQAVGLFLLILLIMLATPIILKHQNSSVLAHENGGRARYSLVVFLDGVLPSMITPQDAPTITGLGQTGAHFTHAQAAVPGDSITDITADLTGTFPTQTGMIYETFYDRFYNQVIELDETPILPPGFTLANAGNLVNAETLFQAAKASGLRTEFTSKYPAYSIENGPQRLGPSPSIDILRTPTFANFQGTPQQYDQMNFEAMRKDILSGSNRPNLYVIYAVAPNSIEKQYGIDAPQVAQTISFEDQQIQMTIDAFKQAGIYDQTDIVVTADHGNTAVNKAIPDSGPGSIQQYLDDHNIPVVQATADQVYLVWLKNPAQTSAALSLLSPASVKKQFGISYFLTQDNLRQLHAAPAYRTPDFAIQPTIGLNGTPAVVYTSPPLGKHVEHGGFNASDIRVPLFVSGPGIRQGVTSDDPVYSMQLAPTLAATMCLNLKTAVLPPLQEAVSGANDCANSQGNTKAVVLPAGATFLTIGLLPVWFFRRRTKRTP
ncbi:MAG TPA: alkaline phosphatase family protein [Ktedonobacteraceae bacterium]|jgi:predicted AlkP superfamily pyrophosphatase or phosphodiesterase|nr:alkaline phosphatase family protein [Ktedonobacteraceae bacterium]